jgi:hypothetical protein
VYLFGLAVTSFFLKKKMAEKPDNWTSMSNAMFELGFRNILDLRDQLASTIGFLPVIWAYMMKQFIPHVILILFVNLARSTTGDDGDSLFGNYGGYDQWPYQVLGYLTVIFAGFLMVLGLIAPDLYNGLTLLDESKIMHGTKKVLVKDVDGNDMEEGDSEEVAKEDTTAVAEVDVDADEDSPSVEDSPAVVEVEADA